MTSTAPFDIGGLIESTPGVYGGQPCLAGTRFPILQLAADFQSGRSPEEIAAAYEGLDLARVYAGLAYYLANREEVDAERERRYAENLAAMDAQRDQRRASA
ncbi:MAG: DUF433 domain-containing protein [Tepidiformaceae bacterium]